MRGETSWFSGIYALGRREAEGRWEWATRRPRTHLGRASRADVAALVTLQNAQGAKAPSELSRPVH
jgi:hypothetical protein